MTRSRNHTTKSAASRMPGPTILIVDDEATTTRELEARLTGMGYDVAGVASSGREAVRLAADTRPSLVLMGIALKGDVGGVEAAAEIRRRLQLPVVYLTAPADEHVLDR